jgi:hypothetical protein
MYTISIYRFLYLKVYPCFLFNKYTGNSKFLFSTLENHKYKTQEFLTTKAVRTYTSSLSTTRLWMVKVYWFYCNPRIERRMDSFIHLQLGANNINLTGYRRLLLFFMPVQVMRRDPSQAALPRCPQPSRNGSGGWGSILICRLIACLSEWQTSLIWKKMDNCSHLKQKWNSRATPWPFFEEWSGCWKPSDLKGSAVLLFYSYSYSSLVSAEKNFHR